MIMSRNNIEVIRHLERTECRREIYLMLLFYEKIDKLMEGTRGHRYYYRLGSVLCYYDRNKGNTMQDLGHKITNCIHRSTVCIVIFTLLAGPYHPHHGYIWCHTLPHGIQAHWRQQR